MKILLLVAMVLQSYSNSMKINTLRGNRTFLFNGIFPITDSDGNINPQTGIMMSEAMRWAIQKMNEEENFDYSFAINEIFDSNQSEGVHKNVLSTFLSQIPFIIGPYSPETSHLTKILSATFEQIVVSYSATQSDFNLQGKQLERMFFRTVPSDEFRIRAGINLIKDLNWTYLAVVSSYGHDGERAALYFTKNLVTIDACLAIQIDLTKHPTNRDYEHAINILNSDSRLNGIVLFTTINDTKRIMKLLKRMKLQKRFTLICMYGCTHYVKVTKDNEEVADGTLTLDIHTPEVSDFKRDFLRKKIDSNSTKEFRLFWEDVFNCTLDKINTRNLSNKCNGTEQLSESKGYYPNTPVQTVIDAVYHITNAIREFLQLYCTMDMNKKNACGGLNAKVRDGYYKYIFLLLGRDSYDDGTLKPGGKYINKDRKVQYDVFQYSKYTGNTLIWTWETTRTVLSQKENNGKSRFLQFWKTSVTNVIKRGSCSKKCMPGYVPNYDKNLLKSKCCWTCEKCPDKHRQVNSTCLPCKQTEMVGPDYHTCQLLPEARIHWNDVTTVLLIFFTSFGLLLTIFVAITFFKYNDHSVVRASGRDLSYMLLVGICIIFLCPFTFITKATQTVCIIRGALPGFAFLTCYAPLFLKTNRIYRIFVGAQVSVSRPPLVNSSSQFVVLCIILSVQLLVSVVWFVSKVPIPEATPYESKFIAIHCSGDNNPVLLLLNLSLDVVFIISCTVLAFKTRRFPKNFNEAKYIGITLYITCVAWAVFLPAYYLAPRMKSRFLKEYLMCSLCVFIGYITLCGLFGQKIKMLFFGPHTPTTRGSIPTWYVRPHSKSTSSNHSYYNSREEETDCDGLTRM